MSEEKIKQLMKEEMLKTIKNDLHSEMIFVYVDNLEKENKQLKEENKQLKIENTYYKYKVAGGNNKIQELKEKYK